jgi:hypothetical protein
MILYYVMGGLLPGKCGWERDAGATRTTHHIRLYEFVRLTYTCTVLVLAVCTSGTCFAVFAVRSLPVPIRMMDRQQKQAANQPAPCSILLNYFCLLHVAWRRKSMRALWRKHATGTVSSWRTVRPGRTEQTHVRKKRKQKDLQDGRRPQATHAKQTSR